jgi:hypothetical protein
MNKAIIKHTSEGILLILKEECNGIGTKFTDCKNYQLIYENLPIDWEQRKYELAKAFEAASLANPEYMQYATMGEKFYTPEERLAKVSIKYADALIKELKSTIHHEPETV